VLTFPLPRSLFRKSIRLSIFPAKLLSRVDEWFTDRNLKRYRKHAQLSVCLQSVNLTS